MLDYSAEVNAAFISQYANGRSLTSAQRMNLRYNTAKFLLYNRFSHVVKELEQKAIAQHEVDVDKWGLVLWDISVAKDVSWYVLSLFPGFTNSSLPR